MDSRLYNNNDWGEGVYNLLSWFNIEKVRQAKVLVAGAGALGNEVIKNLALFGIGHIYVVDFDKVEYSNLTRSVLFRIGDANKHIFKVSAIADSVKSINPAVGISPIVGYLASDVGLGLYKNVDVVIGCLDSRLARIELNRQCVRASVPWVNGGILNLLGNVEVFRKGESCYECQLPLMTRKQVYSRISCSDIARRNIIQGRMPTTPVIASIIGAIQVQEAMKIIHEGVVPEHVLKPLRGTLFKYDGACLNTRFIKSALWNDFCPAHETWDPVVSVDSLGSDCTVKEALSIIGDKLNAKEVEINMVNTRFIERLVTRNDNVSYWTMCAESHVPDYIDNNPKLKDLPYEGINQIVFENIDSAFPYQDITLRQLGIPYWDVIKVSTEHGLFYIEMAKDKEYYNGENDID